MGKINSPAKTKFSPILGILLLSVPLKADTSLNQLLPEFPTNLHSSWDKQKNIKPKIKDFPTETCDDLWRNKQNNEIRKKRSYIFNFETMGYDRFLENPAIVSQYGCESTSENPKTKEEMKDCLMKNKDLLEKPYQDYLAHLSNTLKVDGNPIPRKKCLKKWTILVAMDADIGEDIKEEEDLMPYSVWDLYEMETGFKNLAAGSTLRKDVVVQYDERGETGVRRLHMFQTQKQYEPKQKEFFAGKNANFTDSPVIEIFPESKHPSKRARFVDFLKWGMKEYPAEHYMVILWGHGKGWIIKDEKNIAHLAGKDLTGALDEVYQETGIIIDNFVADACFMQGVELATQISPYARYISGSSAIQTFYGLPYRTLFYNMDESYKDLRADRHRKFKRENKIDEFKAKRSQNLTDAEKELSPQELNELLNQEYSQKWKDAWYNEFKNSEARKLAATLPLLMKKTMNVKNGFKGHQGRLDLSNGVAVQKSIDFFTYSTLDSRYLRNSVVPRLHRFASHLADWMEEDMEAVYSVQDVILENVIFWSGVKTQELGYFIHNVLKIAKKAHAEQPQSEVLKNVIKEGDKLIRQLRKTLVDYVFADSYNEDFPGFAAMGAWLPFDADVYKATLPIYEDTLHFKGEFKTSKDGKSGWQRMLEAISEYN